MITKRHVLAGVTILLLVWLVAPAADALRTAQAATQVAQLAPASPVLLDSQGHCPRRPRATQKVAEVCRLTKYGNVVTDIFPIPQQGEWGLAYSYGCGRRGRFYLVVHLPGMDGVMPKTIVLKYGRHGHGYKMETNNWQDSYEATDPQWRDPQNLVVDSTCAWHVRVVVGGASTVAQFVPPIPPAR